MDEKKVSVHWTATDYYKNTLHTTISTRGERLLTTCGLNDLHDEGCIATQSIKQQEYIVQSEDRSNVYMLGGIATTISFNPQINIFMSGVKFGYATAMKTLSESMEGDFDMTADDRINILDGKIESLRKEVKEDIAGSFGKLDGKLDSLIEKNDSKHEDILEKLSDINSKLSVIEAKSSFKSKVIDYIITAATTLVAAWIAVHYGH